jgi:hypothetical protein
MSSYLISINGCINVLLSNSRVRSFKRYERSIHNSAQNKNGDNKYNAYVCLKHSQKSVCKKARNSHFALLSLERFQEPCERARRKQRVSRLCLKAPDRLKQLILGKWLRFAFLHTLELASPQEKRQHNSPMPTKNYCPSP